MDLRIKNVKLPISFKTIKLSVSILILVNSACTSKKPILVKSFLNNEIALIIPSSFVLDSVSSNTNDKDKKIVVYIDSISRKSTITISREKIYFDTERENILSEENKSMEDMYRNTYSNSVTMDSRSIIINDEYFGMLHLKDSAHAWEMYRLFTFNDSIRYEIWYYFTDFSPINIKSINESMSSINILATNK